MIEDALFLALGFCSAVVLSLALLPLLWARALRLTRQRLELLVPWSKDEIDAERDGLRAQAAIDQRRLEQKAEQSRAALARRDVELGHRTVELAKGEMERDALRTERAALMSDLADRGRELHDAEGQRFAAEKALHDADRHIETDAAAARDQATRYDRLSLLAEERRGTIAALETRVAGLLAGVEDHDDALRRLNTTLAEAHAARELFATKHEKLGAAHAALGLEHDAAQQALAEERRRAVEREQRLRGRAEALAAAEARITEQDTSMKHKDERFEALQKRFDALAADLAARQDDGDDRMAQDARLRTAIVAAGDDTLRLLTTEPEAAEGQSGPRALSTSGS